MNEKVTDNAKVDSPPRAFSQGVGILLQTVGALMFMSTCCICGTSGLWDPARSPHEAMDRAAQDLQTPHIVSPLGFDDMLAEPGKAGLMLLVMTMTAGGLALAGFGLGLQAQRRRAAGAALLATTISFLVLLPAGVGLWAGESGVGSRVLHMIIQLIMFLLVGFCFAAWREMKRTPPPEDVDVIQPGVKIPYSIYHDDPPQVRMAKELAQRRAKLEAEQRELEKMEEALNNKPDEQNNQPDDNAKR